MLGMKRQIRRTVPEPISEPRARLAGIEPVDETPQTANAHPRDQLTPPANEPEAAVASAESRTSMPIPAQAPIIETPAPAAVAESPEKPPKQDSRSQFQQLVENARRQVDALASYQVMMNRQEVVGGTLQSPENVRLSVRAKPRAVRLEWPDGSHKGREVLFASNEPGPVIHVRMGDSVIPVPPMTLALNNPMIAKSSRHPITEAGLESVVERLEASAAVHRSSTPPANDRIRVEGPVTLAETDRPAHVLIREMPSGETWRIALDQETGLPTLVEQKAHDGSLLERYIFRDLKPNPTELADANAFDAATRWKSNGGLLGRLARSTSPRANSNQPASTAVE